MTAQEWYWWIAPRQKTHLGRILMAVFDHIHRGKTFKVFDPRWIANMFSEDVKPLDLGLSPIYPEQENLATLRGKYIVTKADGNVLNPDAQCFVLRIDTDIAARAALNTYAMCYEGSTLKDELLRWLDCTSYQPHRVENAVQEVRG